LPAAGTAVSVQTATLKETEIAHSQVDEDGPKT
jgi:hypothetical protein